MHVNAGESLSPLNSLDAEATQVVVKKKGLKRRFGDIFSRIISLAKKEKIVESSVEECRSSSNKRPFLPSDYVGDWFSEMPKVLRSEIIDFAGWKETKGVSCRFRGLSIKKRDKTSITIRDDNKITSKGLRILSSYKRVTLWNLPLVVDVSTLAHVRELSIHNLDNLKDVPALKYVQKLTLHGLPLVRSIEGLESVREISIRGLPNLTKISPPDSLLRLRLECLTSFVDVSNLGSVPEVILQQLWKVTDLTGLWKVSKLRLIDLQRVVTLQPLAGGVGSISVSNLRNLSDVSPLATYQEVRFRSSA